MVYAAADNDADGPVLEFLDGVRAALDDDPGMQLILFIDRSDGYSKDATALGADFTGARIYRLRKDSAELLDASSHFPDMPRTNGDAEYEVDSSDPKHIGGFVRFCKQRFPARNFGLLIYSHADGRGMCPDEKSDSEMGIPQLTAQVGVESSVDFLALELCNMGGIEIAYQWRPGNGGFSANVLVAIPNAGPPLDWKRAFARIRSEGHGAGSQGERIDPVTMTAAQFGALIVEEGERGRRAMAAQHPRMGREIAYEAAACYDLAAATAVKQAVDGLAVRLADATGARQAFESLRSPASTGGPLNYGDDDTFTRYPYIDVYDLCSRAAASVALGAEVRAAAGVVCKATDALVLASFGMDELRGFEAGKCGLFIVFPDGDEEIEAKSGKSRAWRSFNWYSPPSAAGKQRLGGWSFLGDGAIPGNGKVENWFELLDSWYDDTSQDSAGINGYAP